MDDIYSAILGEPTSDKEKLMVIADQLRKRQMLGQLGQVTGDRVLAPMGAGMVKQTTEQAEDIGRRGETARYRKYQEGASLRSDERARAEQTWREKNAIEDRALKLKLQEMDNAAQLEAARIRADTKDTKKYKQMTVKQVEDLTTEYEDARNFSTVKDDFKDEYSGYKLPGARALTNAMAARAPILATEGQEKAQSWWAKYNNLYTLPERNALFGATLTDNEQEEWKKNAISENMTPTQIRERLEWYETKRREKLAALTRNFKSANYDPELIDTIFSDPTDAASGEEVIKVDE